MSCCPDQSWGILPPRDYTPKGTVEKVGDLEIYVVGKGSSKCIIWNYDIHGFNYGLTKQNCDILAENGFLVLLPDYYRGDCILDLTSKTPEELKDFVMKTTIWEKTGKMDWESKIKPLAIKLGAKTFGTVGTCWGTYFVLKYSCMVDFKAGISAHPSHPRILTSEFDINDNEEELLKNVKCPQLFLPAGNDDPNVKHGGLGKKVLQDALEIVEFPDMIHGWTTRGDETKDPNVARDQAKALNLMICFFGKYLI